MFENVIENREELAALICDDMTLEELRDFFKGAVADTWQTDEEEFRYQWSKHMG